MGHVETATGEILARAILARAKRQEFGILVRDMPEYEPEALVAELGKLKKRETDVRLAMPGFGPADAIPGRTKAITNNTKNHFLTFIINSSFP